MSNSIRILQDKSTGKTSIERLSIAKQDGSEAMPARSNARAILGQTERDPFVAYVCETQENYIVRLREQDRLTVPKGYGPREIYPPVTQTPAERMMGMLAWMVFGLLSAGVVTLILCPLVIREAFKVYQRDKDGRERRLAIFAGLAALALGIIGEIFVVLLVLHMIG